MLDPFPPPPPPDPTLEIQLASQGVSKGLRQTDGAQWLVRGKLALGPALIGASAKNVTGSDREGEFAAYLGWQRGLAGFRLEATASAKFALDPHGASTRRSFEASASVARPIGALTPRIGVTWSPDDLGRAGRSLFVEAGASWRVSESVTLGAAASRRERARGTDYYAWNAGLAWRPLRPVTLDLRYYDTDRRIDATYRARLVGSVRLQF